MKKKDITAKVTHVLSLALVDLQIAPTKKIKQSITRVSKELAIKFKEELKQQLLQNRKGMSKESQRKAKA